MIEGEKYYLTETITCLLNKSVYGSKGDQVTVISISDPAAIVEDVKGERFPVNISKLSEQKVEKEDVPVVKTDVQPKKSSRSKTKIIHQPIFK